MAHWAVRLSPPKIPLLARTPSLLGPYSPNPAYLATTNTLDRAWTFETSHMKVVDPSSLTVSFDGKSPVYHICTPHFPITHPPAPL